MQPSSAPISKGGVGGGGGGGDTWLGGDTALGCRPSSSTDPGHDASLWASVSDRSKGVPVGVSVVPHSTQFRAQRCGRRLEPWEATNKLHT